MLDWKPLRSNRGIAPLDPVVPALRRYVESRGERAGAGSSARQRQKQDQDRGQGQQKPGKTCSDEVGTAQEWPRRAGPAIQERGAPSRRGILQAESSALLGLLGLPSSAETEL